ncbi:hypothetical protein ACI78V_09495 [Geodermatophilus sp. SYSU D00742]
MSSRPTPSRAGAALVTGAVTALYYATPDLIRSRTARGWAKAGLTAVSVAAAVPEFRAAWATARERQELDGEASLSETLGALPAGTRVAVLGSAAAVLAGAAGGVLAAERWVFRRGQARAASGRRWPHTGPALVYGAIAGGLRLLPPPRDPH